MCQSSAGVCRPRQGERDAKSVVWRRREAVRAHLVSDHGILVQVREHLGQLGDRDGVVELAENVRELMLQQRRRVRKS